MDIREHYVTALPQVLELSAKYYVLDTLTETFTIYIVGLDGIAKESGYATQEELDDLENSNNWQATQW